MAIYKKMIKQVDAEEFFDKYAQEMNKASASLVLDFYWQLN